MKRSLLKHASLGARNLLLSPSTYRPSPSSSLAPLAASTQFRVDLHSFESVSTNKSNLTQTQKMVFSTDVEDVSDQGKNLILASVWLLGNPIKWRKEENKNILILEFKWFLTRYDFWVFAVTIFWGEIVLNSGICWVLLLLC